MCSLLISDVSEKSINMPSSSDTFVAPCLSDTPASDLASGFLSGRGGDNGAYRAEWRPRAPWHVFEVVRSNKTARWNNVKRPLFVETGAPAGFQARVGKIRREAPKKLFPLPTLVFSLPTLSYVTVAHPAHRTEADLRERPRWPLIRRAPLPTPSLRLT